MKYERLEDLPVWKDAARLLVDVESVASDQAFAGHGDLKSQLLRAAFSVSNNIDEASSGARPTNCSCSSTLPAARPANGPRLGRRMPVHAPGHARLSAISASQISDLRSSCESISRHLRGWADALQNSDTKGQRHLNDTTREAYARKQRAEAFLAQLQAVNAESALRRVGDDDSSQE